MLDLLKLAIQKPLHALVITLCLVAGANSTRIVAVEKAQAVIQTEQVTDTMMNAKQLEMLEAIIRIDENVKLLKEQL